MNLKKMVSWILLLGSLYITSVLFYDIYKEYKQERKLSPSRWIAIGICLYYVTKSLFEII